MAPEAAQLAYRLKNLTSLPLEIGAAVHEAASTSVHLARSGALPPTADELYASARDRLNKAWMESKDRPAWVNSPKWRQMFHEFYYDTGIGEDKIAASKETLQKCLQNLLTSQSFRESVAAPFASVKKVEEFSTFDIDDTPIHAIPDLVYCKGNKTWTVVDWKSGKKQGDHSDQALVYALYVHKEHDILAPDISVRIEWLLYGDAQDYSFTQDELEDGVDSIRDSIAAMRTYLIEPDLNVPVAKNDFPLRSDTSACKFCNFYEMDEDEIAAMIPGPF